MLLYNIFTAICTGGCQNGGTCAAPGNCSCTAGWIGDNCETGIHCTKHFLHETEILLSKISMSVLRGQMTVLKCALTPLAPILAPAALDIG